MICGQKRECGKMMNQLRMIKTKSWVTNTEIETFRRKIDNEGRDEVNEGIMQESDNIADINRENVDINHADSANEEPIKIIENDLSDSERDRLLRLREALEGNDFGKMEVNLKYGDKEEIKEEVININMVLEHVKSTGFTHCRNVIQAAMKIIGEEVGMKENKDPDRYQQIKKGPKQNRSMVCREMEKGQEKIKRQARSKLWAEKKRVYIGSGRTETE